MNQKPTPLNFYQDIPATALSLQLLGYALSETVFQTEHLQPLIDLDHIVKTNYEKNN